MDEVEEFRSTMVPRMAEAEEAFHGGDVSPRMELWSRRDPVTLFGAAGMCERGWGAISKTFPWVAARTASGRSSIATETTLGPIRR
jgi:hypothetical protein